MKTYNQINGGAILLEEKFGSTLMTREGSFILVEQEDQYVVALQYGEDTEWVHGHYFGFNNNQCNALANALAKYKDLQRG